MGFISLAVKVFMPGDPDTGCHADGGIGAGDEADEHDQGKVLCSIPAEEVKGCYAEEGGGQCIEGTADGLVNGVIGQSGKAVGPSVGVKVFTDTVENNDRFVHGVAKNRKDGGQEGGVHFQMEEGKDSQYHEDIMTDGHNGGDGDSMFKADGHVENHGAEGNEHVQQGASGYFGTDDGTYRFDTLHVAAAYFILHMTYHGLCLFRGQVSGTDDHIIAGLTGHIAGKLDGGCLESVFSKSVTYFFYSDILVKAQFQNGAAGEVNAPVEAEQDDGNDGEDDHDSREGEPDLLMADKIEILKHYLSYPLFPPNHQGL